MKELRPGLEGEHSIVVGANVAVDFLGMEGARVLGTPHLIMLLEMTCRNSIKPLLEAGFDSVGSDVSIKHLAATPIGMQATFRSRVLEVDGRRVRFAVEAYDENEKIAEGTHERFVINVSRFAERVQAKRRASGAKGE